MALAATEFQKTKKKRKHETKVRLRLHTGEREGDFLGGDRRPAVDEPRLAVVAARDARLGRFRVVRRRKSVHFEIESAARVDHILVVGADERVVVVPVLHLFGQTNRKH